MAYDKIVDSSFLDGGLTQIADAIREKNGSSEALLFPDDFVVAIQAIEGGGGETEEQYVYYYNKGDENTALTGGWSGINIRSDEGWVNGTLAKGASSMTITVNNSSYGVGTAKRVDLTNVQTLYINASAPGFTGGEYDQATVWISLLRGTGTDTSYVKTLELESGLNTLDISDVTGSHYIVIDAASDYSRALVINSVYGLDVSAGETVLVSASTTPTLGVTYTSGISSLTADQLNLAAFLISNNDAITKNTSEVYLTLDRKTNVKASVGDSIGWTVNGTSYQFNIIGFNHDDLTDANAYGSATVTGKAGITFQMDKLYSPTIAMNDAASNTGGYGSTEMYKTHLPTLLATMPTGVQDAIKTVTKKAGIGGGSSMLATVSCDLFLLAVIEIFGKNTYSAAGEGTQYAYYAAGNPTIKVGHADGEAHHWNARSPSISATINNGFCEINGAGAAYVIAANTARYQAIALCI